MIGKKQSKEPGTPLQNSLVVSTSAGKQKKQSFISVCLLGCKETCDSEVVFERSSVAVKRAWMQQIAGPAHLPFDSCTNRNFVDILWPG